MKVRPTVLSMIFILSLKIVGYSFADAWLQTQTSSCQHMRQIDQFKKFDKLTPFSLLMIHQTHHLKKCNNQTPLLLPLPPVELCLGRHTCLRLQRQSHLPKFSFTQKLWRPFGRVEARKEGSTERKEKSEICTDIPVKKRMEEKKHSTRNRKKPATKRLIKFQKKNKIPELDSSSEDEIGLDETSPCDDSSD